jgi:hypothetical protein
MLVRKQCALPKLAASLVVVALSAQSGALARGGFPHDDPWNAEHIDRLPPEVRDSVVRMCEAKPNAAHYFATYLDHARIIRLLFEHFACEGTHAYRDPSGCLHEEFELSGSHYHLARSYYDRCND